MPVWYLEMMCGEREGTYKYGEPTVPNQEIERKLRLYVVGNKRSLMIEPQNCPRLHLGTIRCVSSVFMEGGLDAQTIRLEGNIVSRTVGVRSIIARNAGPERIGVCIEGPFSGQFRNVKARFPMLGAAVLTCELAGLPWSAIHLGRLKSRPPGRVTPRSRI
jgi:hypothetical protein